MVVIGIVFLILFDNSLVGGGDLNSGWKYEGVLIELQSSWLSLQFLVDPFL